MGISNFFYCIADVANYLKNELRPEMVIFVIIILIISYFKCCFLWFLFILFFMKWKIGESYFLQVILQVICCTSFYNKWNQRCVVQALVERMKRVRSLFYFSSWEHHDMNIFCWILSLWPHQSMYLHFSPRVWDCVDLIKNSISNLIFST